METEKLRKKQGNKYRNTQLRYSKIVHFTLWEECKQTQCPHKSWRERTKALMWFYSPTKNKLIYQFRANIYDFWLSGQYGKYNRNIFLFHPLGPFPLFPQKWCVAPEFFVLISSHCSTQIWRIRYGGSWPLYFLEKRKFLISGLGLLKYNLTHKNRSTYIFIIIFIIVKYG